MDKTELPPVQKAAQFHPADQSVHINEIPISSIKPDEILVKIKAASLCHSDLMLFEPNDQSLDFSKAKACTMGHEACGVALEIGSEVSGFKPGDKIGWLPIIDCCYDCESCQISNLYCERRTSKIQGFSVDGYFQQYAAIPWRNAAHVPEGMKLEDSAPLFCAGCTSFNAVTDTVAELGKGQDWVAVIGCGGLGHLGIQYLKAYGKRIIGIDISDQALAEAKLQGAEHVFNSSSEPDYIDQVRKLTGEGCHAAINFTNSVAAYSATPALLRMSGILMVTGIPQKPLEFSALEISFNRFRIRGSNNGTTPRLQRCLDFSHKHGIKAHVTQHRLEQVSEMVELMQSGKHTGRLGVLFD